MANALQLRRGTTTEHGSFTGLAGEITVDTTKDTIVVHDGSTQGGIPLAKESAISTNALTLGGQSLSQIQTAYESYTDTEVANLVASAPATLDTLNELAAALGDDPNFATTVTNSIATKLDSSSYTASDVLTKIKTVDGAGSGLDADTVDGIQGSAIVQTTDSRLTNSRQCNNSFDNITTARNNLGLGTGNAVSFASLSLAGNCTVNGQLDIEEVHELVTTSSATSGTVTFNTQNQAIIYFTSNQTANRTVNFSNVNGSLGIGQSMTLSLLATQGSTAYYFNTYQVDGTTVTPKWSGGSAPSAGNASGIDVYTFTIIKTANATFTVLASVTQFA